MSSGRRYLLLQPPRGDPAGGVSFRRSRSGCRACCTDGSPGLREMLALPRIQAYILRYGWAPGARLVQQTEKRGPPGAPSRSRERSKEGVSALFLEVRGVPTTVGRAGSSDLARIGRRRRGWSPWLVYGGFGLTTWFYTALPWWLVLPARRQCCSPGTARCSTRRCTSSSRRGAGSTTPSPGRRSRSGCRSRSTARASAHHDFEILTEPWRDPGIVLRRPRDLAPAAPGRSAPAAGCTTRCSAACCSGRSW